MAQRIEISSYAAIPAILAIAGAAFVMKPEELRRNPLLEVQGLIGMTPKYEVMYARCADGADEAKIDVANFAKGFAGGFSHQFPARSDEDAAHFVIEARPQCDVASLYRLDQRVTGARAHRYRRTRIDI
ncbi:hypothetical protein [Hyphococcus luteus]|uniref:Uncharacterized protein n=1 Tax=Hyphococcus luteus TaxID=2058213 RepID=A0A2S7K0P8_9PROT|nr:hypothetical protein [Marinicaulis flavus]PQA86095.1 hypothetical protein CW354_17155 [Marinicaulis flavus]